MVDFVGIDFFALYVILYITGVFFIVLVLNGLFMIGNR